MFKASKKLQLISVLLLAFLSVAGTILGSRNQLLAGSFPGINGRLFYADTSLHPSSMKIDGSGETELSANSTSSINVSADGTKIAYAHANDIWVSNADGSDTTQLTSGAALDSQPTWAPDGETITFTSFVSGVDPYSMVYNINPDGTGKTLLADVGTSPGKLTYSPDGTKIAYAAALSGEGDDVWVMDADGTNQTRTIFGDGQHDTEPSWSPDGTKLLFTQFDGNDYEIYIADADGSDKVRLTNNSNHDAYPVFSPDGTKIAFIRALGFDDNVLYVMDADGSDQTQVSSTNVELSHLDWQSLTIGPSSSSPNPIIVVSNGTASVDIPSLYTDSYEGVDNSSVTVTSAPSSGSTSVDSTTGIITYTQSSVSSGNWFSNVLAAIFPKASAQSATDSFGYQVCSQASASLCSSGTVTITLAAAIDSVGAPDTGLKSQPIGLYAGLALIGVASSGLLARRLIMQKHAKKASSK